MLDINNLTTFGIIVLVWVLLAIQPKLRHKILGSIRDILQTPFKVIDERIDERDVIRSAQKAPSNIADATVGEILKQVAQVFGKGVDALSYYLITINTSMIAQVFPGEARVWRMSGAFIYLLLTIPFFFADMVQAYNNLSILFPDLIVPELFRDLPISIMISSVGSAFALGIIFADVLGITKFYPFEGRPKLKAVFGIISLVTLLATLVFSLLPAMFRYAILSDVNETYVETTRALAFFSQSAIIVPLFISTLLLASYGIVGLLVLFQMLVLLLVFVTNIMKYFIEAFTVITALGFRGIIIFFVIIIAILLVAIGLITGIISGLIGSIFSLLTALLDLISSPVEIIYTKVVYSTSKEGLEVIAQELEEGSPN